MISILSKNKSFKKYLLFDHKGFLNGIEKDLFKELT